MRTIDEILYQKGPHFNFIDANESVLDAIILMNCENISYLIVTDRDNYVGIISERDCARKIILMSRHAETTLVKEIMTVDLPIVSGSDTADKCMIVMNAAQSRYLPVFDDLSFKGVITMHNLMREAMAMSDNNPESFNTVPNNKSSKMCWV